MVSSQKEYVDNKYDAQLPNWNSGPGLICYLGFHSSLGAGISLDTETFKSENIHILLKLKRRQGNRIILRERNWKNGSKLTFLTWIDLSRKVTRPPGSGAGSYDWSVVRMNASDWSTLITHLPAVSGRKNVAAAPTIEQRPRIRSGRMEE